MAEDLLFVTRVIVLAFFIVGAVVALTHWAVKRGSLSPFGPWPRAVRRVAQPLLRPIEKRLHRSGGNPSSAPYTLFFVALIGGLALLALVQWGIGTYYQLEASASMGARGLFYFFVNAVFSVLMIAILIRVVVSWFGISPYSKPMRVVYGLTDWLILPLRKVIPPFGMIDVTPLVAYFLLYLARWVLVGG